MKTKLFVSALVLVILLSASFLVNVEARQKASYAIFFGSCPAMTYTSGNGNGFMLLGTSNCTQQFTPTSSSNGIPVPSAGTLSNLHISGGQTVTFTVYVNGVASSLSCTNPTSFPGSFPSYSD